MLGIIETQLILKDFSNNHFLNMSLPIQKYITNINSPFLLYFIICVHVQLLLYKS